MTTDRNSISVIICTRNRPDDLRQTLVSLAGQNTFPEEILVIDASDGEGTRELVEGFGNPNVQGILRYLPSSPGLTRQRNVGAREFRGDIALFLDDDVMLEPDYLERMLDVFTDPEIRGAAGINLLPERSSFFGGLFRRMFLLPRTDGSGTIQTSGFPAWSPPSVDVRDVGILPGYNMAYRREVFEEFIFNEEFAGYGLMEDAEFSSRVSGRFRLVQTPNARLIHNRSPVSRDRGRLIFRMRTYHHFLIQKAGGHRGLGARTCFLWAHVGVCVWAVIESVKSLHPGPVAGYVEGLREIMRRGKKLEAARPEEGET